MSTSNYLPQFTAPTTVAVAPTNTTVLTLNTRTSEVVSIQVTNLDGTQTFSGNIYRSTSGETSLALSTIPDFSSIPPGESVMADLDTRATSQIVLVGTMSGAGGNVRVSAMRRGVS